MSSAKNPQALEGATARRRDLGARLRPLAPWLLGLALVLAFGGALVAAARRNLANRAFLIAAMSDAAAEATPLADLTAGSAFQARALAAIARRQGRADEALRQLTADLSADPAQLTRFEACRQFVAQGQTAEAKAFCGLAAATTPYWLAQGIAADESGRAADAIVYFDLARTADPNLLAAWERLGRAYFHAQRYAEVTAVYEHLLQVQPRPQADTFDQLAVAYTALGRPAEARAVLESGLAQHPFQRELQLALADNARAAGDLDEADAWYARLLAQQPDDAYAWARRGELALQGGRAEAAMVYLEQATALEPTAVGYWLSLAAAAAAAGELERATTAYEQSIALRPDDVSALLSAARFFGEAGQVGRARALYERILSLEPDNGPALDALAGSVVGSPTP